MKNLCILKNKAIRYQKKQVDSKVKTPTTHNDGAFCSGCGKLSIHCTCD